mmetsp:Transcript_1232/g.1478  ORF Transcript_1232/g.1478 Transcript_1232/m.1478 type:complete len:573 (-) Transcript_1232:1336-3054(-)
MVFYKFGVFCALVFSARGDTGGWVEEFNEIKPASVFTPTSTDALSEFLKNNTQPITVRSCGHSISGTFKTPNSVMIDLGGHFRQTNLIKVFYNKDLDEWQARIPAAVRVLEAQYALYNLTGTNTPNGPIPSLRLSGGKWSSVCAGGFYLGGGYGPDSRTEGISCGLMRSVQVVLVNGMILEANKTHHSDLFWALRGGQGSFGVVTYMTVKLVPGESYDTQSATISWAPQSKDVLDGQFAFFNAWQKSMRNRFSTTTFCIQPSFGRNERGGSVMYQYGSTLSKHVPGACLQHENSRIFNSVSRSQSLATTEVKEQTYGSMQFTLLEAECISTDVTPEVIEKCWGTNDPYHPQGTQKEPFGVRWQGMYFENDMTEAEFGQIISLISSYDDGSIPVDKLHMTSLCFMGEVAKEKTNVQDMAFDHNNALYVVNTQAFFTNIKEKTKALEFQSDILATMSSFQGASNRTYQNFDNNGMSKWLEKSFGPRNLHRLQQIKTSVDPQNVINHPRSIPPINDCTVGPVRACASSAWGTPTAAETSCINQLSSKCKAIGLRAALVAVVRNQANCSELCSIIN